MDDSVYEQGYPEGAILRLQEAVNVVAPSLPLSIGRWDDRSTWGYHAEQSDEIDAIFAAFDPWASEGGIAGPESMVYEGSPLDADDESQSEAGADEPALDDPGGDVGEEALGAGVDDDPSGDVPDEQALDPANSGGVLIQGDALTTSKALLSWQVDAIEAERLGVYDEAEITSELAALRNRAMGAREYGWTALNDAENEQLQALETFEGHIRAIQAHSRSLRGQIRDAADEPALGEIDIQSGWPE